jgi:hypothetical protein
MLPHICISLSPFEINTKMSDFFYLFEMDERDVNVQAPIDRVSDKDDLGDILKYIATYKNEEYLQSLIYIVQSTEDFMFVNYQHNESDKIDSYHQK